MGPKADSFIGLDYVYYMDTGEPCTYAEPIAMPDAETWQLAMRSKMDSVKENDIWEMVTKEEVERC